MYALMFKSSHRHNGIFTCALSLQGGGVFVDGGMVTFSSCTITGNAATYVRAQLKICHRRWEICSRACFESRLRNCD